MDDRVVAQLTASGFERSDDATWVLDGKQSRWVYVRSTENGTVFLIDVEEWRGGEGYEETELRTSSTSELLEAIPRWAAWAREPFARPVTWWQRLRAYFGG